MQPAQGIRYIHAAIIAEVGELEADAAAAESNDALDAYEQRFARFYTIIKKHNDGEEETVFADLDTRAKHVAAAYVFDHHDEDELFGTLTAQIKAARAASAAARNGELAKLRRHAIALTEHVTLHVRKENQLLTPLICELFTPAEQGAHVGKMLAKFSPELMPQVIAWLASKLDADDRVGYVSMMKNVMPPERFPIACGWVKGGVGDAGWAAITARVPGLG